MTEVELLAEIIVVEKKGAHIKKPWCEGHFRTQALKA